MGTVQQRASWAQTKAELGPRQREVLALLQNEPGGLSAWQIADRTGRLVHAVRPRLTELAGAGLVRQRGERWEERTGRSEAVWVATDPNQGPQLRLW